MLTDERLSSIFKRSATDPRYLESCENEDIEYKESFTFDAQIMKTCAAFANNRGGYIVFGVKDSKREPVGLSTKHAQILEQYDLGDAIRKLNDVFVPTINIDLRDFRHCGKDFGILYVQECQDKPVIATKNSGKIKDRDIYFSYGGNVEKIKRAELDAIIEERTQAVIDHFLSTVRIVAETGVENIAMFDRVSGKSLGSSIQQFTLEKDVLDKMHVLKEGEFTEGRGEPAIKLVAEVETVREHHDISKDTVVEVFLDQKVVNNPTTFLAAICKHDVIYAPFYYYASLAGFAKAGLREFMLAERYARNHTVGQLLERIERESETYTSLSVEKNSASVNRELRNEILSHEAVFDESSNLLHFLSTLRSLEPHEIDTDYVFGVTRRLYEYARTTRSSYLTEVRKTVCYLDRVFYPLSATS